MIASNRSNNLFRRRNCHSYAFICLECAFPPLALLCCTGPPLPLKPSRPLAAIQHQNIIKVLVHGVNQSPHWEDCIIVKCDFFLLEADLLQGLTNIGFFIHTIFKKNMTYKAQLF